jgi:hypothetical protein
MKPMDTFFKDGRKMQEVNPEESDSIPSEF